MKNLMVVLLLIFVSVSCTVQKNKTNIKMKPLTELEKQVILYKGTEAPFTGKYTNNKAQGLYVCRQCGAPLYRSADKFESSCGWPSFDDQIAGAVKRVPDKDGRRTEIICSACNGHLGHVFEGENYTDKNLRHCVNSVSMEFIPDVEEAIFAGGCFWGVEHLMQQQSGVLSVESGYIGGTVKNPTYKEVCTGETGHAEAVRIIYDPKKVDYETLAKLFFEIHDPTQADGQGPDIGNQYRSEVFYTSDEQQAIAKKLVALLKDKGYAVQTAVTKATEFYPAEDYHQDYYDTTGKQPYCHIYTKRF